MITPDGLNGRNPKENRQMKKLMTLMLGAALAFGAVSVYAGQDAPKEATKKAKSTKAKSTKAPKKDVEKK
jgi:hypothetical protein